MSNLNIKTPELINTIAEYEASIHASRGSIRTLKVCKIVDTVRDYVVFSQLTYVQAVVTVNELNGNSSYYDGDYRIEIMDEVDEELAEATTLPA